MSLKWCELGHNTINYYQHLYWPSSNIKIDATLCSSFYMASTLMHQMHLYLNLHLLGNSTFILTLSGSLESINRCFIYVGTENFEMWVSCKCTSYLFVWMIFTRYIDMIFMVTLCIKTSSNFNIRMLCKWSIFDVPCIMYHKPIVKASGNARRRKIIYLDETP